MTQKLRLDLPLLLPDLPDDRDACVSRLESLLSERPGVERAHVVRDEGSAELCLHFDPAELSIADAGRIARQAGARVTRRYGHALLPLRAVDGEDAGRRIESSLLALTGVLEASVSLPAQIARVEFDREATGEADIRSALEDLDYADGEEAGPAKTGAAEQKPKKSWIARNKELVLSLIAGVLLAVAWAGERWLGLPRGVAVALYVLSYGFGAYDLVGHWVRHAVKGKMSFDIDLLMLLAAVGAAALGQWAEGALLLFLFSFAHALEHYAMGRARNAIRALADLAPATARVLKNGEETEVPVEQVSAGDVVVVRPSARIPVDGEVRSGRSSVDQAPITGESVPVEKGEGDEVFAGTVNGDGALEVTTTRAAGDRTLDRVVKLVEEAQTQKAPTQRFTDRFAAIFVPCVLVADVLLIVVPPLVLGWTWGTSFYRAMALLVAAVAVRPGAGHAIGGAGGHRAGGASGRAGQGRGAPGEPRHAHGDGVRQDRHAHRRQARGHGPAAGRGRGGARPAPRDGGGRGAVAPPARRGGRAAGGARRR